MCPKHVCICVTSAEWAIAASLVPRPTPFSAAQRVQRAWYYFFHMCDVKGRKVVERT